MLGSSSRDLDPRTNTDAGRAESSAPSITSGPWRAPGAPRRPALGSRSWAGELCREARLARGRSRRLGRLRRQQVRILSARGTFVQLGRLSAPELPGARRLQRVRLVRTSRRSGARTPARDTKRPRGPGGRPALKRQPSIALLRPNAVGRGQWGARGSGQPRRRRPQAPDRGSRLPGPGRRARAAAAARVEQAGRRGGPAHARRPLLPAGARCRYRRALLSRGRPGPPPFRARHAAAILFTLLPRPAPPLRRTPAAGPPPRRRRARPRWPNLPAPPPQRTLPPPPIGPFDPAAPERIGSPFGPVPGVVTARSLARGDARQVEGAGKQALEVRLYADLGG